MRPCDSRPFFGYKAHEKDSKMRSRGPGPSPNFASSARSSALMASLAVAVPVVLLEALAVLRRGLALVMGTAATVVTTGAFAMASAVARRSGVALTVTTDGVCSSVPPPPDSTDSAPAPSSAPASGRAIRFRRTRLAVGRSVLDGESAWGCGGVDAGGTLASSSTRGPSSNAALSASVRR